MKAIKIKKTKKNFEFEKKLKRRVKQKVKEREMSIENNKYKAYLD